MGIVEEEVCSKIPTMRCEDVHTMSCVPHQETKCYTVLVDACSIVPTMECADVPRPSCEDVQTPVERKVSEEVCVDKEVIHVEEKEDCEIVPGVDRIVLHRVCENQMQEVCRDESKEV